MISDFPRRKIIIDSLACLVDDDHPSNKEPEYHPAIVEAIPFIRRISAKMADELKKAPVSQLFDEEISQIKDSPETDKKRQIMDRIRQRLTSAKNTASDWKSQRPTTTATIRSPFVSRPSTQFSSARPQSHVTKKITDFFNLSPQHQKPQAPFEDSPTKQPNDPRLTLHNINYTNNISKAHNYLRKGSLVVRNIIRNFMFKSTDQQMRKMEDSVQPYNQKYVKQYNQIMPNQMFETVDKKQLLKMTHLLKGPQSVGPNQPNSAFYRTTYPSPPKKDGPAIVFKKQKHSKSSSNLTAKSRKSRRLEIAGWEIS